MRFFCTEFAVVSLPIVDLSDGLPSFKGCVSSALSMQSSVSQSLTYWVCHHSRDAFLLHWVCSRQSPSRWPIGRSIIIQEMHLFCTEYPVVGLVISLLDGMPFFFPYNTYIVFSLTTAQKLPMEFLYCYNDYQSIGLLAKSSRSWDFRATLPAIPFVEAQPHGPEKQVSQTPNFSYSDRKKL